MLSRIRKVRESLNRLNTDSFFISNQSNVTYLTGFSGLSANEREAFLFITKSNTYLLTFPTYYGLYSRGGEGFVTLNITADKKLSYHLNEIVKKENIHSIAIERTNVTLSEFDSLKKKVPAQFNLTENIVEELRMIKDAEEIKRIKKAAEITDRAWEFIKSQIRVGTSEKDLALELEFFLKKESGDVAFSPIIAFSEHAAIPHFLPTDNRKLTTGDLILMDFGAKFMGYCADMTRVAFLGSPDTQTAKIYNTCLRAQQKALTMVTPGIKTSYPDNIARKYITRNGYPAYPHGLGHGVGLNVHEAPRLKNDSIEILEENMVVTVEPGIYLTGKSGIRIEDLVVLTNHGNEVLSKSPKELDKMII